MQNDTRLLLASISSVSITDPRAYIYAIHSICNQKKVIYIGQTNQRNGSLGRLSEHLSNGESATFRQRSMDVTGYEPSGNLEFASFVLPPERAFQSEAKDYREAVEYLVDYGLREFIVNNNLGVLGIARIKKPSYINDKRVQEISFIAISKFSSWLTGCIRSK